MARITYVDAPCQSALNRVQGMPFRWSVNPYTGCAHGCHYCYARAFYLRAERGPADAFAARIYVKGNAPAVLRAELARRTWRRELVVIGSATDPYQPAEARFRLTRGILAALRDFRTPASLITRSPLILRDLDLLRELAEAAGADVNISIPTLDGRIWRALEPGAPPPAARLEAVRRLNAAGIRTGVFVAPILPGLTDQEAGLTALLAAARDAGAPYALPAVLRLAPGVREWFLPHLDRHFPRLSLPYRRGYRQGAEAPAGYRNRVLGLAERLLAELGLEQGPGCQERAPAPAAPRQLRLSL